MTTDPKWLEILSESYTQEVSESARNLQEEADQMFNLIETIETALDVDLTEAQVDALISALSESQRTSRVAKSLYKKFAKVSGKGAERRVAFDNSIWPALKAAKARHNADEALRGPRILKRAGPFADIILAKGDQYPFLSDAEDRSRRADAATLDPLVALDREEKRLKLVRDVAADLKGKDGWSADDTMNSGTDTLIHMRKKYPIHTASAIRTPRKNRDRKKD